MINKRTKFYVGLFVAGGISIAIVAIIWLGMNRFFQHGRFYAVYFDESVQGLNVDSPVKYRGVDIGRIRRIGMAADSRLIEVILMIETEIKAEDNMLAQQKAVGITGSKFIELDRQNVGDNVRSPKLNFPTEYPVLASRPSDISELFHGIDDIVQKINSLDIAAISDSLKSALDNINNVVVDLDLEGISVGLKQSLSHLDHALTDLDLKGISAEIKTSLASLNHVFEPARWEKFIAVLEKDIDSLGNVISNADGLMINASDLIDKTDIGITNLNRHLLVVGQDLERTTNNLNRLLEHLADHPAQLLFGDPPPRRLLDGNDGVELVE